MASLQVPIVLQEADHTAEAHHTDQFQGVAVALTHQAPTRQVHPPLEVRHQVHPAEGDSIKHIFNKISVHSVNRVQVSV